MPTASAVLLVAVLVPGLASLAGSAEPKALTPETLGDAASGEDGNALTNSSLEALTPERLPSPPTPSPSPPSPPPPSPSPLPPPPPPPPPSPPPSPDAPLGSCAIVSSSDSLNGYGFGEEIDTFDEVMRFNLPPVDGYETQVGSRYTIALTNMVTWTDTVHAEVREKKERYLEQLKHKIREDPSIKVHVWIQDPLCASSTMPLCDADSRWHRDECQQHLEDAIFNCNNVTRDPWLAGHFFCHRVPQEDIDLSWHAANEGIGALRRTDTSPGVVCHQRAPSSGLMGVLNAVRRCKTVRLFGFLLPTNGSKYYDARVDNLSGDKWPFHNMNYEQGVYIGLAAESPDTFSIARWPS